MRTIIFLLPVLFIAAGCVSRPAEKTDMRQASGNASAKAIDNSMSPDKVEHDLVMAQHSFNSGDFSRSAAVAKSVCTRTDPGTSQHERAVMLAAWSLKRAGDFQGAIGMLLPTRIPPADDSERTHLALAADWYAGAGDFRSAIMLMRTALSGRKSPADPFKWEAEARRKLAGWERMLDKDPSASAR